METNDLTRNDLTRLEPEELIKIIKDLPPNHHLRKTAELLLQYKISQETIKQGRRMAILTVVMILFMFLQVATALVSIYYTPMICKIFIVPK